MQRKISEIYMYRRRKDTSELRIEIYSSGREQRYTEGEKIYAE